MLLAEALAERHDKEKAIQELLAAVQDSARWQEGEEPAEDARALFAQVLRLQGEIQELIVRINLTNVMTTGEDGSSIMAMLAARDVTQKLVTYHQSLIQAAGGRGRHGLFHRQMRSELTDQTNIDIPVMRAAQNALAASARLLDNHIQQLNWSTVLLDLP